MKEVPEQDPARVVAFHLIADSSNRMDEARRIEKMCIERRRLPKKLFLVGREKSIGNTLKHWREPILN